MRSILICVLLSAALFATAAHAGKRLESCETADLVKGKWIYTAYPCPVDKEEAAKEKACGKDYGELRVGMTLDRFEQCNEALSYVTDTVSQAGTVETYRSTFHFIHAQKGRIVGYTRRTD